MAEKKEPKCAKCGINILEKICMNPQGKGPDFCPTKNLPDLIDESRREYENPAIKEFARLASVQEGECYFGRDKKPYVPHCSKTRIQEVCEFGHKIGAQKMGLVFCLGLAREAEMLSNIFSAQGFEIVSVICKVGRMLKEEALDIKDHEKIMIGTPEAACNPILQAKILNDAKTELNVLLGLCVGHDSLYFKYADAYTTVLAVKDRVTGHNPLAALYTSNLYHLYLNRPGF